MEFVETRLEFSVVPTGANPIQGAHVAVTLVTPAAGVLDVPFDALYLIQRMIDGLFSASGEELNATGNARVHSWMGIHPVGALKLFCPRCLEARDLSTVYVGNLVSDSAPQLCATCEGTQQLRYCSEVGGELMLQNPATYGAVRRALMRMDWQAAPSNT